MFRPSSDPFPPWESPVPRQDQKERWGGMMKRYNLVDSAYCGRRIPLINPPLLSWRAVYKEGEWGKSCAGCFEEGGLRLDNDTHNNNSTRLSEVLPGSGLSKFHFRVLGKSGIPCMTAWLLCICTSSPATSALTLLICYNSGSQTFFNPGRPLFQFFSWRPLSQIR